MLKTILSPLLPFLLLFGYGSNHSTPRLTQKDTKGETGTLEKMIAADGSAAMEIELNRLSGTNSRSRKSTLRFALAPDSFFTILVFNDELRGPLPSSMGLVARNTASVPAPLNASLNQLVVERAAWGEPFEFVVRDGKTGFVFFYIEGHVYDYDAKERLFNIEAGRLLLSDEFAGALGRPSEAGSIVGSISLKATMRAIEITQVVNGEVESNVLPPLGGSAADRIQPNAGSVPGPDVIVGDLSGLAQFDGSSGTQVGLAVATDSCNAGTVSLNWFQTPNNDHPVIPQNLYRMSGGGANNERFEQIGQSNVKHAFTALQQNLCEFGCSSSGTGTLLGSGCSDPYSASLNSGGTNRNLGSRAWINPFNGAFPRADSATPPNSHTGHAHTGTSHRILVEISNLNTTLNPGATYYAEAQYITPHEYAWCQTHPGQCNMYNNVSHRKYNVTGTGSPFSFSTGGSTTVRAKPAIVQWTGATFVQIEPAPGSDGIGIVAYKVTNPSPGVWHYEYAIYNQNLDRAIQSFSVPVGAGVTLSNIGFHAPPQHPGWANDGTVGNTGYSSAPWTQTQAGGALTWSSQTFAQNQNANAVRWGTLYNLRFDSDRPPTNANATVGFFKTGAPITVAVQGPSAPPAGESISARDGVAAEPASGSAPLHFTVALSAPASAGGVSVNYATANDTGGANPATGGASCGGTVDYVNTNGTLNFAAGERLKTVAVNVCADTASSETSETLMLKLSGATNGNIAAAQAVGTITQQGTGAGAAAGSFFISEMRTSGPGGPGDDFVELYNNTDSPLTVAASDASPGYGVYTMGANCNATPVLVGTIPNGTVIPARGHYLLVGSQYGLAAIAAGDQTLTSDIGSDHNIAVFSTADVGNISTVTRLDAAGFGANTGGGVCDLLREGNTHPLLSGSTTQHSLLRKQCDFVSGVGCTVPGTPKDTGDNAADFMLADTEGTLIPGVQQNLGMPGPENMASPLKRDATIALALLDPSAPSSTTPNRARDFMSDPSNNATFGTLSIRRKVTNNTGGAVTRLRFRIVDITTYPPPAGTADLRPLTSPLVVVNLTGGGAVNVQGTTLEQPASQPNGGGVNSSLSAGTITLGAPLANGASVNVQFLLGIQKTGAFRFYVVVEALP